MKKIGNEKDDMNHILRLNEMLLLFKDSANGTG